nr:DUF2459 domain-containing protein [Sphingomonas jejuensis]
MVGGALPANSDWAQTPGGIPIGIETNGIHTGIVLPAVGNGIDWRPLVRPVDLPDPRRAGRYLAFGWGERRFYLETPTWADVTPGTILAAAVGSDRTLVHVDHLSGLTPEPWRHVVRVSPAEYRAIADAIRARFRPGAGGAIPGYGPTDVFYEAVGDYSAVTTCNSWVGQVLRGAGLPSGRWTPFSWSVMAQAAPPRRWRLPPVAALSD